MGYTDVWRFLNKEDIRNGKLSAYLLNCCDINVISGISSSTSIKHKKVSMQKFYIFTICVHKSGKKHVVTTWHPAKISNFFPEHGDQKRGKSEWSKHDINFIIFQALIPPSRWKNIKVWLEWVARSSSNNTSFSAKICNNNSYPWNYILHFWWYITIETLNTTLCPVGLLGTVKYYLRWFTWLSLFWKINRTHIH